MLKLSSLFIILSSFLLAIDKNSVHKELKEKFKDLKSLEINYINSYNPDIQGDIIAEMGNKYIISLGDRVITSDGKTVWNYSIPQKSVLISNFKELNSVSIESIFFKELSESKAQSLKTVSSSDRNFAYELELKNEKTEFNYTLYLDKELNIKGIYFTDMDEEWIINDLKYNIKLNESFKPNFSNDIEVIDLR